MNFIRDPSLIYEQSFATIAAEANLSAFPGHDREIAMRVIHACGMTDVVNDLVIHPSFSDEAKRSLEEGCPIITDVEMVRQGIISKRLARNNPILCFINDPSCAHLAKSQNTTRSAAGVQLWNNHLAGSLVVIGNAPTALFALLEALDSGAPPPAAVVAFPVGFVGAMESKQELVRDPRGTPFATLLGRRGGSAMAAAVVNALAELVT